MPNDSESYVHRSGRTGRAGRSGVAILLHSERERRDLSMLERRTGIRFSKQGPPSVQTVMSAAAALVPKRIGLVDPKLLPYFTDAAREFLEVEFNSFLNSCHIPPCACPPFLLGVQNSL
jgi:ATP-dependent RNA helicase DDX21